MPGRGRASYSLRLTGEDEAVIFEPRLCAPGAEESWLSCWVVRFGCCHKCLTMRFFVCETMAVGLEVGGGEATKSKHAATNQNQGTKIQPEA